MPRHRLHKSYSREEARTVETAPPPPPSVPTVEEVIEAKVEAALSAIVEAHPVQAAALRDFLREPTPEATRAIVEHMLEVGVTIDELGEVAVAVRDMAELLRDAVFEKRREVQP